MDPKRPMAVLLGAVLATACGGGGGVPFRSSGSVVGAVDGGPVADNGDGGLVDLGQGIQLSRARFVIASLTLAGRPDADAGAGALGNRHLVLGPIVAEMGQTGDGGLLGFTVELPPGRFPEARFAIAPVEGDGGLVVPDGDAGVTAAGGGTISASFVVEGLVAEPLGDGGTTPGSFSFGSSVVAGQTAKPADGDGGTQTVTLSMDPSNWFQTPGGIRLDPTDPGTHEALEDNIRHSILVGGSADGGQ